MEQDVQCPVCSSIEEERCTKQPLGSRDAYLFDCMVCGTFEVSRSALVQLENHPTFTPRMRAVLSHRIRVSNDSDQAPPIITTHSFDEFVASEPELPTPGTQALNIIRYIGEHVTSSLKSVHQVPASFHASIGSPNRDQAMKLTKELLDRGLLSGIDASTHGGTEIFDLDLTLDGWQQFEAERQGKRSGSYGFIALQFGDPVLDPFLQDVIKPAVSAIGFSLEDMRDAARAGIIDNVMRARIRDAAFVLVDLTHANEGAYWEAGYAEGLGKPVLYLCRQDVFEAEGTHFDTNHCTTVKWSPDAPEIFREELKATLRRSLGLFGS